MGQRGEITVFLSMCLLTISALLCVMLESARTAGSRYYFQVAVNSSLDTLFSQYHRQLWEQYRVLGLEYQSEDELKTAIETYVNRYLETDNWYPLSLTETELTSVINMSDDNGNYLAQEVLSYMKFGILSQLSILPEEGEQFFKDIREAAGADTLTMAYDRQEKEVRKLEEAVERLNQNIQQQEQIGREIEAALRSDRTDKFYKAAKSYRREAARYPELMKTYEKQMRNLAKKQDESREKINEIKPEFQQDREQLFEQQWNPYDAYIREDGERYQEYLRQQQILDGNLELLEAVEETVDQIVAEAQEDDEEDWEEPSLSAAAWMWEQFVPTRIVMEAGNGDREKRNLLDRVQQLVGNGILGLVLPEGTEVSDGVINKNRFPSEKNSGIGSSGIKAGEEKGNSMVERVLIDEYCSHFFLNALSKEQRQIQYEMEYLLHGCGTDRENLEKTAAQLFAVREGLNLIHILSDAQKRDEARALALTITGSVGLAPLSEIMACVVMGVWAMGETVQDLRILMAGGKVPLWKTSQDWQLSLEGLLEMGRGNGQGISDGENSGRGFCYGDYLKLLLLVEDTQEKHLRMLDLMQMNIQRKKPYFDISRCAWRVDIHEKACGKHVFFSLPFVEKVIEKNEGYALEAIAQKAY